MSASGAPSDNEMLKARVQALEAELSQVRAEMQHFAYAVSHDLRAPLRHIVSYAQLVQEDAGDRLGDEVQGFLGTITESARHLGAMLDALAAWSRVGTAPLHLEAVDLQALVDEVCASLTSPSAANALRWDIASGLPQVQADAALLRQALQSILGNAVKFSAHTPEAVLTIAPSVDPLQGMAGLCVRDNGAGYNPAQQGALFKVFGRLHSAQKFPGLGMGLATTQRIVERLGGRVAITSPGVGQGACVSLLFQSAKAA